MVTFIHLSNATNSTNKMILTLGVQAASIVGVLGVSVPIVSKLMGGRIHIFSSCGLSKARVSVKIVLFRKTGKAEDGRSLRISLQLQVKIEILLFNRFYLHDRRTLVTMTLPHLNSGSGEACVRRSSSSGGGEGQDCSRAEKVAGHPCSGR